MIEKLKKMSYFSGFLWSWIIAIFAWLSLMVLSTANIEIIKGEWFYSLTGLIALWFPVFIGIMFILTDLKQSK